MPTDTAALATAIAVFEREFPDAEWSISRTGSCSILDRDTFSWIATSYDPDPVRGVHDCARQLRERSLRTGVAASLADAAIAAIEAKAAMTLERAAALNRAMINLMLEREGLAKCPLDQLTLLRSATLAELAQAGPIVEAEQNSRPPDANGSRTFSMVCDDRCVAAVYAFLHFTLPPASSPYDDDHVIMALTDTTHTYFLISGARERRDEAEDHE